MSKISQNNRGALAILKQPRITEKATDQASQSCYVFEVGPSATKTQIKQTIKALYKVTPLRVNVSSLPAKKVFIRGKRGVKSGVRKAMVFLKSGDKIEIV